MRAGSRAVTAPKAGGPWRIARGLAAGALGLVAVAAPVSAWVGTKILTDAPRVRRPKSSLRARFHGGATTTTAGTAGVSGYGLVELTGEGAAIPGTWGLRLDGGYAQIGDVVTEVPDGLSPQPGAVLRPYTQLEGRVPTPDEQPDRRRGSRGRRRDRGAGEQPSHQDRRHGDRRATDLEGPFPVPAAIWPYAWPDDPQILARQRDADWSIDAVPSADPGRTLPAWRFTPRSPRDPETLDTWVIGVHGRGARRSELYRLVQTGLRAGVTCLVVSYRTDGWTSVRTEVSTLGHAEWEDLEAAVRLAHESGARRIVLAGCSLGGAICATFLRRSSYAGHISGVILDAPALAWAPILGHIARGRRLPAPVVPAVLAIARLRARIDFEALDHLGSAADFVHPILLIHGSEDPVVPVLLSDAFAAARPDLVTYLRVEGAGHVHAWNHDRSRYETAVRTFLAQLTHPGGPAT